MPFLQLVAWRPFTGSRLMPQDVLRRVQSCITRWLHVPQRLPMGRTARPKELARCIEQQFLALRAVEGLLKS